MSNFSGLYNVRAAEKSDESFITFTFLRGLYYGDSWFSLIPRDIFMSNYKKVIQALIADPDIIIYIACLKEDPAVIIGYSILSLDAQTIHWVYVKKRWRNNGIAKALLPKFPTVITHLNAVGKTLMSKFPNVIFNPFNL